ncbi:MAG: ferredoxin [Cyclobacteriaceae bacterium]
MKPKEDITTPELSMDWFVDDPASETERKAFWRTVRHFYRTGEKANDVTGKGMTSALAKLITREKLAYPFSPDGDHKTTIDLTTDAHMRLLNHLLSAHQKQNRKRFKSQLAELINGLKELLKVDEVDEAKVSGLKETFGFAEELIAFDKLVEVIPEKKHKDLTKEQADRLQSVVSVLVSGLSGSTDQLATVIVPKEIKSKLITGELFDELLLVEGERDVFDQAYGLVCDEIHAFAELMKSERIGNLEISGDYQEDIHDEYFEHFTWHRLLEEELALFRPVLLIVDHNYLFKHLSSFSRLLASNLPVNVIVVNDGHISAPNQLVSWEDASHQFRQELALIVMAHRNVYLLQVAMNDPQYLYNGLKEGIQSVCPTIYHIMTADNPDLNAGAHLQSEAVVAGRYFPAIKYDPNKTDKQFGKFDLFQNIQPQNLWPKLKLKVKTSDQAESEIDVAFTYADYKAMFGAKVEELMVIPSAQYSEDLIALADYLTLKEKHLYGKIPFIWLIDDRNQLHRAAVPNVWVVSCQERVDFWSHLQNIAGLHDTSEKVKSERMVGKLPLLTTSDQNTNQPAYEKMVAQLEKKSEARIAKIKEESMFKASQRVVSALLRLGQSSDGIESLIRSGETGINSSEPETVLEQKVSVQERQTSDKEEKVNEEEVPVTSKEAWVESEDCTSCNDCVDKYGHIFTYNDEKQAFIKDASKGSYEELVKAAENCPAGCIHPGLPSNPNEANMEALLKRAEKFN